MNKNVKSVLVLVLVFVLAFPVLFGLDKVTAPVIEAKSAMLATDSLKSVLPGSTGFETLYDADNSSIKDVPETVTGVYKEKSGKGYAVLLSTTKGYTGEPIEIALGVNAEGKIAGTEVLSYPDSKDFGQKTYPATFVGQDSNLPDVGLIAGVTYSSSAFKNAIKDAFAVLVSNGFVPEGVKTESQILAEMIPLVHDGFYNGESAQYEQLDVLDKTITLAYKSLNDSGCAFIINDNDQKKLAVTNATGSVGVYDVNGEDITNSTSADILSQLAEISKANTKTYSSTVVAKLQSLTAEGAECTPISLDGVYSTVTEAYKISAGGSTYYGFAAREYAYSNAPIYYYYVLNSKGAIYNYTVDTHEGAGSCVIAAEYFPDYTPIDETAFRAKLSGKTIDTYSEEYALIAGATFSTNANNTASTDVFNAFKILSENGGIN